MTPFHIGVDLEQKRDHTAIAIVGARQANAERRVLSLERVPLGMPYPTVVERVRAAVQHPELYGLLHADVGWDGRGGTGGGYAAVGATGLRTVGGYDHQRRPRAQEQRGLDGAEAALVCGVQVMLERGDLRIASQLPDAASLVRELRDMRVEHSESGIAGVLARG